MSMVEPCYFSIIFNSDKKCKHPCDWFVYKKIPTIEFCCGKIFTSTCLQLSVNE